MAKRRRLNLQKTLFVLPNLITLSSIYCGFDSIRRSGTGKTEDDFYQAALLIVFAMVFDMLDGRVARMTKTQSAFGLQIDSLADVVSFGVAPAILVYQWSLHRFGTPGLVVAFLFTAAGAVRLARFNVLSMDTSGAPTKPSKYIVGLPIPGAAGVLVSLVLASHAASGRFDSLLHAGVLVGVTLALSFFMVSTVKFRSFKDLKLNLRTGLLVLFALGSSITISTQLKPAFVLVWLLGCYVLIALFETGWHLTQRLRGRDPEGRPLPPR